MLDRAHNTGFERFVSQYEPDSTRASEALEALRTSLNTDTGPNYKDYLTVAAYLVRYHLKHCGMTYQIFSHIIKHVGGIEHLSVYDVGSGTSAGAVGLMIALSDHGEGISVCFEEIETSSAMSRAGALFRKELEPSVTRLVECRIRSGAPAAAPDSSPKAPKIVSAFHLALPYGSSDSLLRNTDDDGSRTLRETLGIIQPDIGLFTCHRGKLERLKEAVECYFGEGGFYTGTCDVPRTSPARTRSRLYTRTAPDHGFDVQSVDSWGRYRFETPKDAVFVWGIRHGIAVQT